jgi:small subunit ribosomal protein S16
MSVKLRFMRFGKRSRPYFRLCAIDSRAPRDGAYLEAIGHYSPLVVDERKRLVVNKERAEYWLGVGAQPSETVAAFFRKLNVQGVVRTKKPPKKRRKKISAKKARAAAEKAAARKQAKAGKAGKAGKTEKKTS